MYFKEVMFFYCAGINVVICPLIFFSLLADRVQARQGSGHLLWQLIYSPFKSGYAKHDLRCFFNRFLSAARTAEVYNPFERNLTLHGFNCKIALPN